MNWRLIPYILSILIVFTKASAQEYLVPLSHNIAQTQHVLLPNPHYKTTALNLPFFEDFIGETIYPDPSKWIGHTVYINNTMCLNPISKGVATFDALNAQGGPYDSINNNALVYADSLTSQPINLSANTPGDSIYMSFFYQPQGNGFAPETQDSLMLYFKKQDGTWDKVWSKEGTTVVNFQQVILPLNTSTYLHGDFQFRFVNKASINLNDDVWNVDYIRLSAGRSIFDTLINDIATSINPTGLLNDLSFMPYRHFVANKVGELATQHSFTVKNNYTSLRAINYGYTAKEKLSNTPLFSSSILNTNIAGATVQSFPFPSFPTNFNAPNIYAKVIFEQAYYAKQVGGVDEANNDTIRYQQVFDNYMAYDDGTAEKSYFLKQFTTLPAKLAIEFHLNQPDTVRGVSIYFGRQVPLAFNKFFSLAVYKDIAVNGGTDQQVYQEDLFFPGYVDTVNHFWTYKFDSPVPLPAGTFYICAIQPASSGSDSLYYGFDANRTTANHMYINLNNFWEPSIVTGVAMIRPLLGQPVKTTNNIISPTAKKLNWSFVPNPASNSITIQTELQGSGWQYHITDMLGRELLSGLLIDKIIAIESLPQGTYIIHLSNGTLTTQSKKLIKF